MASFPKLLSFLVLVALVSSPLALAGGSQQYFAKARHTNTITDASTYQEEEPEEPQSTAFRSKAQTFAADNQLYSNQYSSNGNPNNYQEAATYNYNPATASTNRPTVAAARSKAAANPTTSTGTKDLYSYSAEELANYYSTDTASSGLNKNYQRVQNSKVATTSQNNYNDNNYYNGYRFGTGNKKSSSEQQQQKMGMSDTRFLGNGKYFYNINKLRNAKNINSVNMGGSKAVYNQETYNPTTATNGRVWGNHNSQALAQDDDDEGDEISP